MQMLGQHQKGLIVPFSDHLERSHGPDESLEGLKMKLDAKAQIQSR
jgi:hypothetical protein